MYPRLFLKTTALIIALLVVIGLTAGVLSGLLGIGGGTLFTPVLFYLFNSQGIPNPELWTIGTSLFCTFAASSGGTIKHIQQHSAFIREGFTVGAFGVIGTALGKYVATSTWFTAQEFLLVIGIVFLYTGINFIRKGLNRRGAPSGEDHADSDITPSKASTIGGAGGFVAALSGLGGGVLMVPIMNLIYKFTLRKSVSVSETAIVSISLAGWLQYILRSPTVDLDPTQLLDGNLFATVSPYSMGYIDFGVALPLVIGAFIGSGFGVKMHDKINTRIIKIIFGVLLLLVAARMAVEFANGG